MASSSSSSHELDEWTLPKVVAAAKLLLPDGGATATVWKRAIDHFVEATPFHPDFGLHHRWTNTEPTDSTQWSAHLQGVDRVILLLYAPSCPNCLRLKPEMTERIVAYARAHDRTRVGQINMKDSRHDILRLIWSVTHIPRVLIVDRHRWTIDTWEKVVEEWNAQEKAESCQPRQPPRGRTSGLRGASKKQTILGFPSDPLFFE